MLSPADLHILEGSLLPALERHHLRLLAHSLRCLQAAAGSGEGATGATGATEAAVDAAALEAWARRQPGLVADPGFIPVLVAQLGKAALQLEQIAAERGKPALALEMEDLVAWGKACADARLRPPHS